MSNDGINGGDGGDDAEIVIRLSTYFPVRTPACRQDNVATFFLFIERD